MADAEKTPSPRTIDTKVLKQRLENLKADRSSAESLWDQIDKFVMPLGSVAKPKTQATEQDVEWSRWEVWDSTAIDGHAKLTASIHSNITSPALRWFKMVWRNKRLRENQEAATWLEQQGDAVFDELQDSDFGVEIQGAYGDLVGPGTAVVIEEPASDDAAEWKGLDFSGVPLREWWWEEDSRGGIEKGYRELAWSPVQWVERFGDQAPKDIIEAAKSTDVTKREPICFCLFRRPEAEKLIKQRRARNAKSAEARARNAARAKARATATSAEAQAGVEPDEQVDGEEPVTVLAPHLRPVGGVYFRVSNGEPVGDEVGYYEMPACLAVWSRTTGSRWGHGQGTIALPTVKYLNAYMEADFRAAEKVVDPSWIGTERNLLGPLDNRPGRYTAVRDPKNLVALESHARFDVSERKLAELRAMVRAFFHVDELQLKDSPQMTAMEAQIRYELMQRVLGAPLNRIEKGLLTPIVQIAFATMLRAGRLKKPPQIVLDEFAAGGADYTIEYLGPLARSQRADQVASIERLFAFAGAMLKMGVPLPIVQSMIDFPEAVRAMAKLLGCPQNMLKAKDEVEARLKELAQAQQRAQEAALQEQEGKAAVQKTALVAAQQEAQAGAQGGAPGASGPVPAQPEPIVSPSFQGASPFAQPPPGSM